MLGAISDVQIVGNPLFQEAMSEKTKNNSFVAEDLGTIALLSTRQASWAAPASCFLGWLCPEEKWLRTFAYEREKGQEMPPQAAHIISNIQGMDMERECGRDFPFAHITPSHKQPMRHKPDSWLSSGIWQCATFENYGPLSFGGGPLFCPGKLTMQSLSKDMVHLCLLRLWIQMDLHFMSALWD